MQRILIAVRALPFRTDCAAEARYNCCAFAEMPILPPAWREGSDRVWATCSLYLENRSKFSQQELQKFRGNWVAFSADGRQIVANAVDLDGLENELIQAGLDPEKVVLEQIPDADMIRSGIELS